MDDKLKEFDRLISRIERHQTDTGLSNGRFAARYAKFIGSEKTWADRLKPRDFKSIATKIDKWLQKCRQFADELDGVNRDGEIHAGYPIVRQAIYLYDSLNQRRDDRRCGWLLGIQGTGKTLALRYVQRENPAACVFLSANETWKDSRMCIARAIAAGIGSPVSASASETFHKAVARLKEEPTTLLVDEAHEGGVLLMKLVKTIINETPSRVILAQYPTTWHRLNNGANDAYAEAQQLLRRTQRPVKTNWMAGLQAEDVKAFFKAHEMEGFNGIIEESLATIQQHGNYSLLADAHARASLLADDAGDDITPRLFKDQLRQICGLPVETKEAA
jgi:hypothetical protein